MATQVQVRAIRAFLLRGDVVSAGSTVRASLADAALVLESGRGELVDAADIEQVRSVVQAATAAALKLAGSGRLADAPAGPRQLAHAH